MAARSNQPGDIIVWIENIIASCTHPMQEIAARKLIDLFDKKLERTKYPESLRILIHRNLRDKIDDKMYNRIQKNLENNADFN